MTDTEICTKLYGGSVELRFDPIRHIYSVNGKRADGVTGILGIISKPALIQWASNMAAEYLEKNLEAGKSLDEIQIKELVKAARYAHRRKKDTASDIGSFVHDWAECFIKGRPKPMPINPQIKSGIDMFLMWVDENKVRFFESEKKVYSLIYNYAGTMDFVAEVNGKKMIGDFKTSNGIWPEFGYQLAAYRNALEEENCGHSDIVSGIIVNTRKDGILDTRIFDEYEKDLAVFKAALVIYRRELEHRGKNGN